MEAPCILILDPIKGYHSLEAVAKPIRSWLNYEWKARGKGQGAKNVFYTG